MAFLKDIDEIRQRVDWAPKHLWDIKFVDKPTHKSQLVAPFTDWFPASDITIEESNLNTYGFELSNQGFELPLNTSQRVINVTFFDSANYDLLNWLRTWIQVDILNNGKFVSRLDNVVKTLLISKLTSDRLDVESTAYFVYPKGQLLWEGTSQPGAQQYSIPFVIAGSQASSSRPNPPTPLAGESLGSLANNV